ncbi:glycoside hydrolase family 130 protein [Erythrobacter litoralis]|uniref:glycoside hydrolase family 130 protein n=1 Tax=Erythrobacter litoralis TaxID=39960 RepID=UPI002434E36D|nr:glycoside hydrolase family 130 protein [Erythrobacter litoralis]
MLTSQGAFSSSPLTISEARLHADPSRVVLRPFHLGWQSRKAEGGRAQRLIRDIAALNEAEVSREYHAVQADFQARHWQTDTMFADRFAEVEHAMDLHDEDFSEERKRLIGAYFCHEYTYSAAALMNPSIVPHPDQSGMEGGACRFVMSLRAVGEGHISSIAFREGIMHPGGQFELWPQSAFATSVELEDETLTDSDAGVTVHRHRDSTLSNTVIFPITEQQRNGLEDLRLVRFDHGDGDYEFIGTYTAYSGSTIRSELLRTRDFKEFLLEPIAGGAARNKGMALFPEKIGGEFAMIGRQDGKNLFLLKSDELERWEGEGTLLMEPEYPWEFIQIGNCGSPVKTDAGWLLLTHGVGPMRKYALGCALLDLEDPSKVIARSPKPILTAVDADRAGYVPNVVYTCGMLKVGDEDLLIPYGISDSAVGFATTTVNELIDFLV